MRIIIIGAGTVGAHLAERLAAEGQDIVVVEADDTKADNIEAAVDCMVVRGNGASTAVLEQAGVDLCRLLIAVTNSDAANILACQAAAQYEVPLKVARVEDSALRSRRGIAGVDVIIDPGEALARELVQMIRRGSASEIHEFARGDLVLLSGYVQDDAPLAGMTLAQLRENVRSWDWLVAALVRDGETLVARGDTDIQAGDRVMVMASEASADEALGLMGLEPHRPRKVVVMGASRLASMTAGDLVKAGIPTILVDSDAERCRRIAAEHERLVVVNGDPTDPKVLRDEGADGIDAVLALSGWDEVNIVGCLVATALGVPTTVARFQRFEFVDLLAGVGVDVGVSSRLSAADKILRFVRRGLIHSVTTFQGSDAEAIEMEVSPDSPAVGKTLREVHLPPSAIVGGIIRKGKALIPHGDTVIESRDDLIMIVLPDARRAVEKVFG
jgi:trk system potassium uptake protein TrkA